MAACAEPTELEDAERLEEIDQDGRDDAEMLDGLGYDHGYDAIQPPVLISWDLTRGLSATVHNPHDGPSLVELAVLARGATEEDLDTGLGTHVLEAGESMQVDLEAEQLPIQTQGAPTEVRLVARVEAEDAPEVEVQSSPVRVGFDEEYRVSSIEPAPVSTTTQEALDDRSRMLASTGRLVAPDDSSVPITPELGLDTDPAVSPWLPPDPLWPPLILGTRVCPTWRAHYEDPNSGQDYLAASGTQHVPASYAYITITTPTYFYPFYSPGTLVWQGYLDAEGCTPSLTLDGTYVFSLQTRHRKGDVTIETRYSQYWGDYFGHASGSFSASSSGGLRLPTTGDDDRATRVAALISQALVTEDLPIRHRGSALKIWAHQPCPGPEAYGACYRSGTLYVGDNDNEQDLTLRRHVVAHELGHAIQARAIDWLAVDYDDGDADASQLDCRCDHVEISNKDHCLQSRETLTTAFAEGFGHYVAVKLFNDPHATSCRFSYYKEFRNPSGTIIDPPVNINCDGAYRWMENRGCADPNRGTEYDWMNFLWAVTRQNSDDTLTLDELWDVFRASCPGVSCYGDTLSWASLEAAALSSPDLSPTQKNLFDVAGSIFGVDH